MKFLHAAAFAVALTLTSVPVLSAQDRTRIRKTRNSRMKRKRNSQRIKKKKDRNRSRTIGRTLNRNPTKTNLRVRPSGASSHSGKMIERVRMTGQRRMSRSGMTQNEAAATASRMNASVPALAPSITSTWRGAMTGTSNTAVTRSNM